MAHCASCRSLAIAAFTVLGFSALGTTPLPAQQLGNQEDTETPFTLQSTRFGKLAEGKATVDLKQDKKLLEVAARHYIFRVTWSAIQKDGMQNLQNRFTDLMSQSATVSGANKEFMKLLAHEMIGCFKQVLAQDLKTNYQAVTNAALMLKVFGKCRQEEVHDFLMEVARPDKDGKYAYPPFVRMCAIHGLGEFNNPYWSKVDDKEDLAKVEAKLKRDADRLALIGAFVAYPYPPEGSTPEHWEAWVFVRREGIKALAQVPVPAYRIDKTKIHGPAAHYLLYIASGGKFEQAPPLTLAERLEAALGICQFKTSETPQYNADLGVYVTAACLVDFARAYIDDHRYFSEKVKDKVAPRLHKLPWKSYAARFEGALDTMASNIPSGSPAAKKLETLRKNVNQMLANIRSNAQVESPDVLGKFVESIRPTNLEVYQGFKEPVLLLPKND